MLDIASGLGGASQAMRDRGWRVVTVDIDPGFEPDIVADIATWSYDGPRPDLLWCSPPCDEFAREFMPWCKTGVPPDMSLLLACVRLVEQIEPRFWVIENVKGAITHFRPILGDWSYSYGPFFLWGHFPDLGRLPSGLRKKESYSSARKSERAIVPYALSHALAVAIERQPVLPGLDFRNSSR